MFTFVGSGSSISNKVKYGATDKAAPAPAGMGAFFVFPDSRLTDDTSTFDAGAESGVTGTGGPGASASAKLAGGAEDEDDNNEEDDLLGRTKLSDAYRRRQEAIEVRHRQLQQSTALTSFL